MTVGSLTPGYLPPPETDTIFPPTSRYFGVATATTRLADDREVAYLRRRFIPPPESMDEIGAVVVGGSDRLDLIAARVYGQPELHWRVADANRAFDPADLTAEPGTELRVTTPPRPESGGSNA